MPARPLRTAEIARAVGVHPNTIRLYEQWGFLPPVPRTAGGYRQFTQQHLDQMRLARLALHGGWPGRNIRQSALALVRKSAGGNLGGALEQAHTHLALVRAERAEANIAAAYLEKWAGGTLMEPPAAPVPIREAAVQLHVTVDMLRNWEKNGLIAVPRDPRNGYRRYGTVELGRLRVIRMLSRAGYSAMAILRMLYHLDRGQKKKLRQVLDTPRPDEEVLSASDQWLSALAEQEQRARQMIAQLQKMIRRR